MRGTRWLLLVVIAAILGGIGYKYQAQRKLLNSELPPAPATLELDTNAKSQHWHRRETDHVTGRTVYDIDAEEMRRSVRLEVGPAREDSVLLESPEDTILRRLFWRGGEASERQWQDVVAILAAGGGQLDADHLDLWARELNVTDLLERARNEAKNRGAS